MRTRGSLLLIGACLATAALAADVATGRAKAVACAACHGPLGLSVTPDAPNLAGQPPLYVTTQLKAYRDGTRKHEVMTLMAKPLSDADIDALAAWFGSLKVQVQPVP
ncbi:MAG: cytochrome c [Caldimonas sp.]